MDDFSPQPQWHPPWSYLHQCLVYLLYPLVLLGVSLDLGFTILLQMLHTPRDFMHQVQCNNNARYSYLQRQLHWSNARWKKEKCLSHRPILTLSPLHYGVFSNMINLDRFNLFYLGYTTILHWGFYQAFFCFMNSHGLSVPSFAMLLPFTFQNGQRNHRILSKCQLTIPCRIQLIIQCRELCL
jgi:hypothetical protein